MLFMMSNISLNTNLSFTKHQITLYNCIFMIHIKKRYIFSSNVETTRHIPHTYIRLLQLGNMFKIPSHLQKAHMWVLKVLLKFANASKSTKDSYDKGSPLGCNVLRAQHSSFKKFRCLN
jgi:hypothetical protein